VSEANTIRKKAKRHALQAIMACAIKQKKTKLIKLGFLGD